MDRRRRRLARATTRLAVGVAAGLAVVSCGADAGTATPTVQPGLAAAWSARPIPIGGDVVQAAVRTCRLNANTLIPSTSTAVVADVRGGGRIAVVFSGPREQVFLCLLAATADGGLAWSSGWGGDRHSAEGPLRPDEIRPEEPQPARVETPDGTGQQVFTTTGRVGRAVSGVDLALGSGETVRATTAGGWYAAWWPTDDRVTGYQALDGSGQAFGPLQH